jgi:transposase-like protein
LPNGTRAKTVFTEIGPVEIEVPRDTNSTFDPQIVRKRQRRLTGIYEIALSLTAKASRPGRSPHSTNAVESLNARYRQAIRARGHFPTEQAAMKCLYLVTRPLDSIGRGKVRLAKRWKPGLDAFAITFNGRIAPTGN